MSTEETAAEGLLADWIELTKPRITLMVLLTAGIGMLLAAPGMLPFELIVATLSGTWLVAAGSASLNHAYEHQLDSKMERTANRPVAAGRMSAATAVIFGLILGSGGLALLAWKVNLISAILGAVAFVSYVVIYTPLKMRSSLSTVVGAVPGALPPMMGWTAVTGEIQPGAWALFGILFLWQMPHFLAIAWMCREDYARAGFPMLPVVQPEGHSTALQMVLYSVALIPVSLAPTALGLAGWGYFCGALAVGLLYLWASIDFSKRRTDEAARRVLMVSVVYLPAVLGVLAIDRLL